MVQIRKAHITAAKAQIKILQKQNKQVPERLLKIAAINPARLPGDAPGAGRETVRPPAPRTPSDEGLSPKPAA